MWNPFKKAKNAASATAMGMMAKIAEKKLKNMSPQEREKMAREAFDPKNKGKLLSAMEMMRKGGQISEEQYREAKKMLDK